MVRKKTKKKATKKKTTKKKAGTRKSKSKPRIKLLDGDQVGFEVVVTPEEGGKSVFDDDSFVTPANIDSYRTSADKRILVARKLQNHGIRVHHVGEFSISASCPASTFTSFFNTKLSKVELPKGAKAPDDYVMRAPAQGAPWKLPHADGLDTLIERAYVQHRPIFFADERPIPPKWADKFRLRVPTDIAQLLRATSVHLRGITGKGVRVAMCDTGFYHHPYFKEQGYNFMAVTAPDAIDHTTDPSGHGTGECANLFATAPEINFIGVKMGGNPTLSVKTAVDLRPQIMTNSWGFSYDGPLPQMPNFLKPLHLAVLDAVARGITVCFSAGNGHYAFPGSMPEVISVGGVIVDEKLNYSATKYTSGFDSTWFPGRRVPDVCGLCGAPPTADYIVLPVQAKSELEREGGWGAFSGTSAASPMVAGVCALLVEAGDSLLPDDIKHLLVHTARDITKGVNAHGRKATPGPDGATGFGLGDAERAIDAIL